MQIMNASFNKKYLFAFILMLNIVSLSLNASAQTESFLQKLNVKHSISGLDLAKLQINNQDIIVELAQTSKEREIGLMNRLILPKSQGMLFIFPQENHQSFWMKNTKIALDILFFNAALELVTIHQAVPCKADPCPLYSSRKPVKYVLELAAGSIETFSIIEGLRLQTYPK